MVLDDHSAASIAERLGIPDYHQLYRGKETRLRKAEATAAYKSSSVKKCGVLMGRNGHWRAGP